MIKALLLKKHNSQYLTQLQVPAFIGVIDEDTQNLDIYSGETVSIFYSMVGPDIGNYSKVFIKCVEQESWPLYEIDDRKDIDNECKQHTMLFPKVLTVATGYDYRENPDLMMPFFNRCKEIQRNISSRANLEFLFLNPRADPPNDVWVVTGDGSQQVYFNNFLQRLAESLANLTYALNKGRITINDPQLNLFQEILANVQGNQPELLLFLKNIGENYKRD